MSCESSIVVFIHTFFVLHVGMAKWVFGLMEIYCMGTQSHVPRLRMSRLPIIQLLSVWRLRSGDSSFKKLCINHTTTYQSKKKKESIFCTSHTTHAHTHTHKHKHIHHPLTHTLILYISHYASFLSQIHTHGTSKVYIYIHWGRTILPYTV